MHPSQAITAQPSQTRYSHDPYSSTNSRRETTATTTPIPSPHALPPAYNTYQHHFTMTHQDPYFSPNRTAQHMHPQPYYPTQRFKPYSQLLPTKNPLIELVFNLGSEDATLAQSAYDKVSRILNRARIETSIFQLERALVWALDTNEQRPAATDLLKRCIQNGLGHKIQASLIWMLGEENHEKATIALTLLQLYVDRNVDTRHKEQLLPALLGAVKNPPQTQAATALLDRIKPDWRSQQHKKH